MSYVIHRTDGTTVLTLAPGVLNTTKTSLVLAGRGYIDYGEVMAENLVAMLENFADDSSPLTSTSLPGQLWYQKFGSTGDAGLSGLIKVFDGTEYRAVGASKVQLSGYLSGEDTVDREGVINVPAIFSSAGTEAIQDIFGDMIGTQKGITVTYDDTAAKINFDHGSLSISSQGQPVIEAIAEILRSCPDLRLRIAGYTDSQGRETSNLQLSQSRAEAVLISGCLVWVLLAAEDREPPVVSMPQATAGGCTELGIAGPAAWEDMSEEET